MRKIKVRLKCDLTKYATGLIKNSEGYTVNWSRLGDCFVVVCFPNITNSIDVTWDSLEIIDIEYLKEKEEKEEKFKLELKKTAKDVVLTVGPRGGLKYLSYKYVNDSGTPNSCGTNFRSEMTKMVGYFEEFGIDIKTKIE
jgi:hypothetical protein